MNAPIGRRMPRSLMKMLTEASPKWDETEITSTDEVLLPPRGPEESLSPSLTSGEEVTVDADDVTRTSACMLCAREPPRYTCPRCNLLYCSLACYRSPAHSACSEDFYRDSVMRELRDAGAAEDEGRRKMQETLLSLRRRAEGADGGVERLLRDGGVVSDGDEEAAEKTRVAELLSRLAELQESGGGRSEEIDGVLRQLEDIGEGSDGEDGESGGGELDLAARFSELDVEELSEEELWELLSGEEKARFASLVKDGGVAKLVPPWRPWWEEHEQDGRALIEMLDEEISKDFTDDPTAADKEKLPEEENDLRKSTTKLKRGEKQTKGEGSSGVPGVPPISDKIPTLSSLCANPSPLICFGLANALYAYAFSLCLVNNDTDSLTLEFCDVVLALSEALNSTRVFGSLQEAIESGESRIYAEGYLDRDDRLAPSRALEAAAHIATGRNVKDRVGYCLAAFSQLRSALSKARKSLSKDGEERERRQRYFLANKKCEFLQAWIVENEHQVHALALELWEEHGKRECARRNMEKTKALVTSKLKKEKNKSVKAIEELN